MRWRGRRASTNVEDRRGMPRGRTAVGGGLGTLVLLLIVWMMGGNPLALLQQANVGPMRGAQFGPIDAARNDELSGFISVVLADTEDVWNDLFARMDKQYQEPRLVLFTGEVQSACGFADSAVGPFYCPGDRKVYMKLAPPIVKKTLWQVEGDSSAVQFWGSDQSAETNGSHSFSTTSLHCCADTTLARPIIVQTTMRMFQKFIEASLPIET